MNRTICHADRLGGTIEEEVKDVLPKLSNAQSP